MKRLIFRFLLVFILFIGSVNAEFFISAKNSCGYDSYNYKIGPNVSYADLRIRAGPNVSYADIRIKLVSNPRLADLIFVDENLLNYSVRNSVDMKVCKRSSYANKRIRVGPNVSYSDIRVRVGPNVSYADYKLYFNSSLFTVNEAAGLFPAIWKFNEN